MSISRIVNKLRYARNTVHCFYGPGIRAWLIYLYYGLLRINKFIILQATLEDVEEPSTKQNDVTFLIPTIDELNVLRSEKELPEEFFCDKFQKVSTCCIALVNKELACIHWIYFAGDYSRFLKMDKNSAEINYLITLRQFRGSQISTEAIKFSMEFLKSKGIKKVFAVPHAKNLACKRSLERAGFVVVGHSYSIGHLNLKKKV